MVTDKLKKLQEYQCQMAKLEKELAGFNRKLLALPGKFGFRSMDAFIQALKAAGGTGAAKPAGRAAGKPSGRKPRAKITPEMKQKLKAMVSDGKTGAQIAKALNISAPSVQNIKKELGLVKARK
jgi:hypothetical protein